MISHGILYKVYQTNIDINVVNLLVAQTIKLLRMYRPTYEARHV